MCMINTILEIVSGWRRLSFIYKTVEILFGANAYFVKGCPEGKGTEDNVRVEVQFYVFVSVESKIRENQLPGMKIDLERG